MSGLNALVDLASERFGGRALLANDEFFAEKENLLKEAAAVFLPDEYTDRGKWMDGWETRRRREPGHDWCIVRLGLPGSIHAVTVDTSHFRGNHPESCSVEACTVLSDADPALLAQDGGLWVPVVARTTLTGHNENHLAVEERRRFTHVRLNIFPDGGVARLRVHGRVLPDWDSMLADGERVDLVGVHNGGWPVACSDRFFSHPLNLIRPDRAVRMDDGWETRRRRGPGHDWLVLELGRRGELDEIEVDTSFFKGNFPESCSIEGCDRPGATEPELTAEGAEWFPVLERTRLHADTRHFFEGDLITRRPLTHVRLNIFPDGGVSRLRLLGRPADPPGT